ncbi:hypothetical protein [Bacillus thuringiensis]|uniref:hypothetical protein n=1 Tax=Bacillus thuringiensis TaxID=1428 RepID=UPI0015C4FE58|nr:hypothetical protein [Bacillus thuringiensis]
MHKRQLFNLNAGDCIYVYSGGKLEGIGRLAGQGRYVCVVEDKNESFLCWRKHNGNEVYTNLNGISVETISENTAYLQDTRDTCERGYKDTYNQNTSDMYLKEYNEYNPNTDTMYEHRYDTYDQNTSNMYDGTYNQNLNDNHDQNYNDTYDSGYNNSQNAGYSYDQEYNTYDQNTENTYDQNYEIYNPDNNYAQHLNDMYNPEYTNNYNQNSGCRCDQGYNRTLKRNINKL